MCIDFRQFLTLPVWKFFLWILGGFEDGRERKTVSGYLLREEWQTQREPAPQKKAE
ncbi:MAG: hypothetical protein IMHGJWDQ_001001 [Candidatus Fervidibacter sp.]